MFHKVKLGLICLLLGFCLDRILCVRKRIYCFYFLYILTGEIPFAFFQKCLGLFGTAGMTADWLALLWQWRKFSQFPSANRHLFSLLTTKQITAGCSRMAPSLRQAQTGLLQYLCGGGEKRTHSIRKVNLLSKHF